MKKTCIGIIFGGESNEHEVSISSAKSIYKAFKSNSNIKIYSVLSIYINKKGQWFNDEDSIALLEEKKNIEELQHKEDTLENKNFLEKINFKAIDVWFPVMHGNNCEDGTIQGLLKLTHKPIVGTGILGSALGMDKIIMKSLFSIANIPQVKYLPIQNLDLSNRKNLNYLYKSIQENFNLPIFIKPANSGSSIGITKVTKASEINKALISAWDIDHRIIVEEGLNVRELECGVIGKSILNTSEVGEVRYESEWYDYESKYKEKNQILIPADISPEIKKRVNLYSTTAFRILNIEVFGRIDFFLEKNTNNLFINEINTIPGFTDKSMFPMLWKASGLEIEQLVAKLVNIAINL